MTAPTTPFSSTYEDHIAALAAARHDLRAAQEEADKAMLRLDEAFMRESAAHRALRSYDAARVAEAMEKEQATQ